MSQNWLYEPIIKSRVCFPDMKPSHFIDRKEWAINDGQNPSQDLLASSLAITTESRISETLFTDIASYKNLSCGREVLEREGEKRKKERKGLKYLFIKQNFRVMSLRLPFSDPADRRHMIGWTTGASTGSVPRFPVTASTLCRPRPKPLPVQPTYLHVQSPLFVT